MRLKTAQLGAHLKQPLQAIYIVSGDEPLQNAECSDAIRSAARQQGFTERVVLHVEAGFDWSLLAQQADSLSLFATRRLLELRLGERSPADAGSKALQAYAANPPSDMVLLITAAKWDGKKQKTVWFKALEKIAVFIQVWDIERQQLAAWISNRAKQHQLQITPDAVQIIADRSEGHLLACAQEIDKLQLLFGSELIDVPQVLDAVVDSARFGVFGWLDAVLAGDAQRSLRQLQHLREEGQEPILLSWALHKELRTLYRLSTAIQNGESPQTACRRLGIWQHRQSLLQNAVRRYPMRLWQRLLQRVGRLDRIIKGSETGDVWDELQKLGLFIAGVRLFAGKKV